LAARALRLAASRAQGAIISTPLPFTYSPPTRTQLSS